jgi:hypothetical protein
MKENSEKGARQPEVAAKHRRVTVDAKTAVAYQSFPPRSEWDPTAINPWTILKEPVGDEEAARANCKTEKLRAWIQDDDLGGQVGGRHIKRIADEELLAGNITQEQYVSVTEAVRESLFHEPFPKYPGFESKYGEKRVISEREFAQLIYNREEMFGYTVTVDKSATT